MSQPPATPGFVRMTMDHPYVADCAKHGEHKTAQEIAETHYYHPEGSPWPLYLIGAEDRDGLRVSIESKQRLGSWWHAIDCWKLEGLPKALGPMLAHLILEKCT